MTREDYIKIAECIKNFKNKVKEQENTGNDFNEIQYLIDEFAYMLEQYSNFNETKFRDYIYD